MRKDVRRGVGAGIDDAALLELLELDDAAETGGIMLTPGIDDKLLLAPGDVCVLDGADNGVGGGRLEKALPCEPDDPPLDEALSTGDSAELPMPPGDACVVGDDKELGVAGKLENPPPLVPECGVFAPGPLAFLLEPVPPVGAETLGRFLPPPPPLPLLPLPVPPWNMGPPDAPRIQTRRKTLALAF